MQGTQGQESSVLAERPGGRHTPGQARHAPPTPSGGVVIVDAMPLFRAGAVAALTAAGARVDGEAAHLPEGIALAQRTGAAVLVIGGATVAEVRDAVPALPACAVVALVAQPSRTELVEMLDAGVAGLATRSLTADELVAAVEAAAEASGPAGTPASGQPVLVPLPVGLRTPDLSAHLSLADDPALTPKELEILAQLAEGASNKRIAAALYVTPATVKTHLGHIYAKLGARGRHEALSHAFAMGILR